MNIFSLIETINSYYPLMENINGYYLTIVLIIIYLLYYLISNSFMVILLVSIGIFIGFYIIYLMRDTLLYFYTQR
jgi:hypothetical protein